MEAFAISITLIVQLFILINPLSSFPFLCGAHEKKCTVRRKIDVRMIAIKAVITAFVIAVIIILTGPLLFKVFDISLDAFRIAGGIVLLLLGLDTIKAKHNHEELDVEGTDSLISIIATPLMTGPATISFLTLKTYEIGQFPVLINATLAFIIVGIVFITGAYMIERINQKLISITSRVLGLFLTALAIEMIAGGLLGIIAR